MTKWYFHEIAVSGVMDVLIFVPFALAFYYLGKWWLSIKLNDQKEEIIQAIYQKIQDLEDSLK